jgi:mRNA-degrading endonuclease toxin of MazEF toxin-antitoxin module
VVVSRIATVAKTRLLDKIGTLDDEKLEEVIKACRRIISLRGRDPTDVL